MVRSGESPIVVLKGASLPWQLRHFGPWTICTLCSNVPFPGLEFPCSSFVFCSNAKGGGILGFAWARLRVGVTLTIRRHASARVALLRITSPISPPFHEKSFRTVSIVLGSTAASRRHLRTLRLRQRVSPTGEL